LCGINEKNCVHQVCQFSIRWSHNRFSKSLNVQGFWQSCEHRQCAV
jgi:hypothetical protein